MFKLPYGLRDGRLVHVDEVERGIACGCVCPACGHRLMARKGEKTSHHFAHYKGEDCKRGYESAIHIAAKELIEKYQRVILPTVELCFHGNSPHLWTLSEVSVVQFDRVELEKRFDGFRPDVVAYKGDTPLIIEITVTNETSEEKLQRILDAGISVLEIDLKRPDYETPFTFDELEDVLFNLHSPLTHRRKWLINMIQERTWADIVRVSEQKNSNNGCEHFEELVERLVLKHLSYSRNPSFDWFFDRFDKCRICRFCMGREQPHVLCSQKTGVWSRETLQQHLAKE